MSREKRRTRASRAKKGTDAAPFGARCTGRISTVHRSTLGCHSSGDDHDVRHGGSEKGGGKGVAMRAEAAATASSRSALARTHTASVLEGLQ